MTQPLIIERWADNEQQGAFGHCYHDGEFLCDTVERPWLNNMNNISCVPAGMYDIEPFTRPNGDKAYLLVNEDIGVYRYASDRPMGKGRYLCLIHKANWMTDVEGCIGPGNGISFAQDRTGTPRMMVKSSGSTCDMLFDYIEKHGITKLLITWKEH